MMVMLSISELLMVDMMSSPASEVMALIEPEMTGTPSMT